MKWRVQFILVLILVAIELSKCFPQTLPPSTTMKLTTATVPAMPVNRAETAAVTPRKKMLKKIIENMRGKFGNTKAPTDVKNLKSSNIDSIVKNVNSKLNPQNPVKVDDIASLQYEKMKVESVKPIVPDVSTHISKDGLLTIQKFKESEKKMNVDSSIKSSVDKMSVNKMLSVNSGLFDMNPEISGLGMRMSDLVPKLSTNLGGITPSIEGGIQVPKKSGSESQMSGIGVNILSGGLGGGNLQEIVASFKKSGGDVEGLISKLKQGGGDQNIDDIISTVKNSGGDSEGLISNLKRYLGNQDIDVDALISNLRRSNQNLGGIVTSFRNSGGNVEGLLSSLGQKGGEKSGVGGGNQNLDGIISSFRNSGGNVGGLLSSLGQRGGEKSGVGDGSQNLDGIISSFRNSGGNVGGLLSSLGQGGGESTGGKKTFGGRLPGGLGGLFG